MCVSPRSIHRPLIHAPTLITRGDRSVLACVSALLFLPFFKGKYSLATRRSSAILTSCCPDLVCCVRFWKGFVMSLYTCPHTYNFVWKMCWTGYVSPFTIHFYLWADLEFGKHRPWAIIGSCCRVLAPNARLVEIFLSNLVTCLHTYNFEHKYCFGACFRLSYFHFPKGKYGLAKGRARAVFISCCPHLACCVRLGPFVVGL